MVVPGAPLYRVVDLSALKAEVGIPQGLVSRVRVGSPAQVSVPALGNRRFAGEVRAIGPQADAASGAFPVEVHVENPPDKILRAGMTARVEILTGGREKQLAVPEHALVARNGDRYVYRISQKIARLTPVSVDAVFGDQAIISGGLAPGDTVVVVGMKSLGVETRVWIETLHQ
jgi:RND family efflux transporter MFP subunit